MFRFDPVELIRFVSIARLAADGVHCGLLVGNGQVRWGIALVAGSRGHGGGRGQLTGWSCEALIA